MYVFIGPRYIHVHCLRPSVTLATPSDVGGEDHDESDAVMRRSYSRWTRMSHGVVEPLRWTTRRGVVMVYRHTNHNNHTI